MRASLSKEGPLRCYTFYRRRTCSWWAPRSSKPTWPGTRARQVRFLSAPAITPRLLRRGADMYVLATAGHVDHGKSTLVRALTGMEPDRWAEEQRRGMTLDLRFAWTELPSGATV